MINNDQIKWKDGIVNYLDDDGTIVSVACKVQVKYYVYVLLLNEAPVYVGCTSNIDNRMIAHKKNKIFNGYKIVFGSSLKSKAYNFEIISIELLKSLGYDINYNKQKKVTPATIINIKPKKSLKNG